MEVATIEMVDRRGGDDRREGDRRRGRPPLAADRALRSNVSIKFTEHVHDELLEIAREQGLTLTEFMRELAHSELRKRGRAQFALL